MSRMGARWGRNITGVCPSAALDSLPPSEPRAPFPATAVGATSVAVAFPSLLLPQTAADGASRPPGHTEHHVGVVRPVQLVPVGVTACRQCA